MNMNPSPNQTRSDTLPERERNSTEQLLSSTITNSSKQAYTTEIVKALGGPAGDVVQDVPCSYQRQTGRLYVSTDGLFFYSNLFGFEKRIGINYDRALEITKVRTTTLLIRTVEGEEYAFRSFDNREMVLETIRRYHSNSGTKLYGAFPAQDSLSSVEANPAACDKSLDEIDEAILGASDAGPIPVEGGAEGGDFGDELHSKGSGIFFEKENVKKRSGAVTNTNNLVCELIEDNAVAQWTKLRQLTQSWESAITDLNITYKSIQDFFDSFLMNDAANSLCCFLRDVFQDSNISITKWEEITTEGRKCLSRIIDYDHKAGITLVKVLRNQTYQRYGINSCLRTLTSVKGIRGVPSDMFFVEDMWFLENADKGIILNAKFHVKFTKSTMLRSVIQKRASAEAREWYTQYALFLRRKMNPKLPQEEDIVSPTSSSKANVNTVEIIRQYLQDAFTFSHTLVLIIIVLVIILYQLKLRVLALELRVLDLESTVQDYFERRLHELDAAKASSLTFRNLG
jgi:hypothetical protein